jgi:uncharacterized protein (TIGR03086 family)
VQLAVDDHLRGITLFCGVVSRARPTDLRRPTPCEGWAVRDLLAHQLGQDRAFTAALAGGADDVMAWAPVPVGDDVPAPLLAALDEQHVALGRYGDPTDRTIWMPEILPSVPLPALRALGAHLIDLVVHSWDLAVSIGVPLDVPPGLVDQCLRMSRAIPDTDETRGPGRAFAPGLDASAGAAPFDEVLMLLGRDPRWRAPAG